MNLQSRIRKLETRLEPEKPMHIICGGDDEVDGLADDFLKENPDFDGLLILLVDYYKEEDFERPGDLS